MHKTRLERLEAQLRMAFKPTLLEIEDQSHLHAGHAGARDGKGHFSVLIVADVFVGQSTLKRHRMIYSALSDLMQSDIHALSIDARDPQN